MTRLTAKEYQILTNGRRKIQQAAGVVPVKEWQLQMNVVEYVHRQYPDALITGDALAGLTDLGPILGAKAKKMGKVASWPDLTIHELRHGYVSMDIELKKEGEQLYRLDGEMYAKEHIRNQAKMHELLRQRNHFVCFAVGLDEAKQFIDWYLG